jgi:DNA (cytosine-5)-methyltransferase 1
VAKSSFSVISTFSGCGGSSLGYQLAGGKVLLAVEWDDNAVETYRLNFPDTPIYHGDIGKLSAEECCKRAGIEPGELDILDGSPPCQGFSTAGKRDFGDDRNQLFREYVRLLRGLKPKVFVMENVSGMVKGKMKLIFAECLRELKASGYKVKARLLNTMHFNVPQSRRRLIFIGVRNDLGIKPQHPKAITAPISLRNALEGCPQEGNAPELTGKRRIVLEHIRPGKSGESITGKGWFTYQRCHWDRPACTIQKEAWQFYHPSDNRNFSVSELRRIASYPDTFQFAGNWRMASSRIGNSVPPNFMRAIAEHIRDKILVAAGP